jgi:pimeloyl-ACP methyl ester carboxylesterase
VLWLLWVALGLVGAVVLFLVGFLVWLYFRLLRRYMHFLVRIVQEKPLFKVPQGQPTPDAEEVRFPTTNGLTLHGLYLPTRAGRRAGVIVFGLEFGSNRWACVSYCTFLRDAGFDVFTFEYRGQGDSASQAGYDPLQWVTEFEVQDFEAALAYLRGRPDADPRGVGLFGLSKGACSGLVVAARNSYVRCFVTDGIYGLHTTMLPYMRKWISIYNDRYWLQRGMPDWFYLFMADEGLRRVQRERNCRFVHLEKYLRRLGRRPLLMIHGEADTYIKPEMARKLFERVRGPKELWVVDGAKHNQAFHQATEEYQRRVLAFFQTNLTTDHTDGHGSRNGDLSHPCPSVLSVVQKK